jgi:plasmid stabilization system protein ParE
MASEAKFIEFTPLARLQLEDLIDYIINEFGRKRAEKFVHSIRKTLRKYCSQPACTSILL